MNTNNGVKWRRFIVPNKVEQINDHLFIDTYKSNNIKIGANDMTVNDRAVIRRCQIRFDIKILQRCLLMDVLWGRMQLAYPQIVDRILRPSKR